MPIGKNSISRVAGEPAAEPAKVEAAPAQEKKAPARKPRTTTTAKSASATTQKSTPKKPPAPKAAAPKAEVKTETVERIEKVAEAVTQPATTEDVKAYVSITDELPTYLL